MMTPPDLPPEDAPLAPILFRILWPHALMIIAGAAVIAYFELGGL